MATQTVYLSGTTGYSKLDTPDKYEKYTIQLYMNGESKKLFDEAGLQLKVQDDGSINLRRPDIQRLMSGEEIHHGQPKVVDSDGNPIPSNEYSRTWTGAEVTCKCVVYDTMKGKGHRLEAIRVEKDSELATEAPETLGDVDVPF